ncbi:hypothetical protein SDC9_121750 [bioreactor metagenome]|uniref:Uncharacterized protein n=1 Tax=bioreactor metagenome TaxID=1076179 RepID=A0A645CCX2_9ZZZZ
MIRSTSGGRAAHQLRVDFDDGLARTIVNKRVLADQLGQRVGNGLHVGVGAPQCKADNRCGKNDHKGRQTDGYVQRGGIALLNGPIDPLGVAFAGALGHDDHRTESDGDYNIADHHVDLIDDADARQRVLAELADDNGIDHGQKGDEELIDQHGNHHLEHGLSGKLQRNYLLWIEWTRTANPLNSFISGS